MEAETVPGLSRCGVAFRHTHRGLVQSVLVKSHTDVSPRCTRGLDRVERRTRARLVPEESVRNVAH